MSAESLERIGVARPSLVRDRLGEPRVDRTRCNESDQKVRGKFIAHIPEIGNAVWIGDSCLHALFELCPHSIDFT